MTGVSVHLVVYLAVNGLLLFIWMMTGGPREDGFWPLWVMVPWGTGLAIHAGIALTVRVALRRRRAARGGPAVPAPDGRSWIAAMFVDLTGSTALAERLGDEEWARMIARYRSLVGDVSAAHGGSVVGTQGDGLLLRFASPREAVRCAVHVQRRLETERAAGSPIPPARIGIHAGEALAREGDVLGQMVNLAARVADTAGPGEILVSEPVADHATAEASFDDRGLVVLRGATAPRHLLAVRWHGRH